jgi:hypothetical protein
MERKHRGLKLLMRCKGTPAVLLVCGTILVAACATTGRGGAGQGDASTPAGTGGAGQAGTADMPAPNVKYFPPRPLPHPVPFPPTFQRAIERGTRTTTGEPGPRYWLQQADYQLTARLFPEDSLLRGSGRIRYTNNSPDTLTELHVDLLQNMHAAGTPRNEEAEITGGVMLHRVTVSGVELDTLPVPPETIPPARPQSPSYRVNGTRLLILPPQPVLPRTSVDLAFDWEFKVPRQGTSGRMGRSDDELYFLAYWYPQMTVYDDVVGWHPDPFLGTAEFYADFASYDVTIDAPSGWVVMATGRLENGKEVLQSRVLERLRRAEASDAVVAVLTPPDRESGGTLPGKNGRLSWHFRADSVHDFAFSASRRSNWDAARSPVGDRDGDGEVDYARVDAIYRDLAPRWKQVARYAQHSIKFLSRFTGLPYPWPHMSVVEGSDIITGGMEFPMMTIIGDYNVRGDSALYNVTVHEIAHMWVPMIVSNDERRYGWMDEGTTTFNENQARKEFFPGSDPESSDLAEYAKLAQAGEEGEMMRRSDYHYPGQAYTTATYEKPASVLWALRGVLGEETFLRGYRAFLARWAWKHPYPWDLFNTFEAASGQDLDWFWHSWYYETWTLDQAVASVTPGQDGTSIVIEDRGLAPMPVHLTATLANGKTVRREVPVDVWLKGATSTTVTIAGEAPVTQVEIDPERKFPDVNRKNNVWMAGASSAKGKDLS